MTLACLGHWYLSVLYLAPVAIVIAGLSVVNRVEKRREAPEESGHRDETVGVGG